MENVSHYICLTLDPKESDTYNSSNSCSFQNLKNKNIFSCVSKLIFSVENYTIIKKTGTINDVEINIILTYYISKENSRENKLLRGYLYVNEKEYEIKSTNMYRSLQINEWCYDNIQIIQLDVNIFSCLNLQV